MESVLVVGGAGFIGSYIIEELFTKNRYKITVLDNLSEQIHGKNYYTSYLYNKIKNKTDLFVDDVRNYGAWTEELLAHDYLIYLASETGTGQSMYEINKYNSTNIMGLSNLFDKMIKTKSNIKKIILSSSRSVYGEGKYFCKNHGVVFPGNRDIKRLEAGDFEIHCPICDKKMVSLPTNEESTESPLSLYAFTKLTQEKMLIMMASILKVKYTIFRYQNVYGTGQSLKNPYTGILSIFSKMLLQNNDINIFEDGKESRDFVHVKDIAKFTTEALKNVKSDNQIINIGTGLNTTVLDIAHILKEKYSSNSKILVSGDYRVGDIRHNCADLNKITKIFEEQPNIKFRDGINSFCEWVLTQNLPIQSDNSYKKSLKEMKDLGLLTHMKDKK